MKHGKKPTVGQMKMLLKNGYDPNAWLVVKDKPDEMVIVSRANSAETASVKKTEY